MGGLGLAPDDSRFALAWALVDEMDQRSVRAFESGGLRAAVKDDGSPVTDLDRDLESHARYAIARDFPADAITGEEGGSTGLGLERWLIDPIDGTANLLEGVPIYAHQVAYGAPGVLQFSIVSAPVLRRRWWAVRGAGAQGLTGRLALSTAVRLDESSIAYGGLRDHGPDLERFVGLVVACRRARGYGNFLPHMLVADGTYDLGASAAGGAIWDVEPLQFIVEEAGGVATDLDGRAWREKAPLLTGNPAIHRAAIRCLTAAVAN